MTIGQETRTWLRTSCSRRSAIPRKGSTFARTPRPIFPGGLLVWPGRDGLHGRYTDHDFNPRAAGPNARNASTGFNMDVKLFATVFMTIFIAELGDKTQLATILYASDAAHPKLTVFAASAAALVLTTALGVLAGSFVAEYVNPKFVRWVAGAGFIGVGLWVLMSND